MSRRSHRSMGTMTAFRTAAVGASVLFVAMLVGMLWLALGNSRIYLEQQLGAHAQQTATLLGMMVADPLSAGDNVAVDTSAGVIYDRGYYTAVTISAAGGKVVSDRRLPTEVTGVPAWFTRLVRLDPPMGRSLVTRRWHELGRVTVVSHPQFAYLELWRNVVVIVLSLSTGHLALLLFLHRLLCRSNAGVQDAARIAENAAGISAA